MERVNDINIWDVEKMKHSLFGKNLTKANLPGINLVCGDLRGAKFNDAFLMGAMLMGANLCKTNFTGANLAGALLNKADLKDTNFRGANLKGADLRFSFNLTHRQLGEAVTDDRTVLPDYLLVKK